MGGAVCTCIRYPAQNHTESRPRPPVTASSPRWKTHFIHGYLLKHRGPSMASPASLLSWKKWTENNQHGMPLLCSFCQWCNHQDFSGKTRPCWGFQRRWKVTVVSYIFKEYGLIHWVFFWFMFCDLPWKQFSSLSLSRCLTLSAEKAEKKSILQRFTEDGELAGETLAIHTTLPQAFCWEKQDSLFRVFLP